MCELIIKVNKDGCSEVSKTNISTIKPVYYLTFQFKLVLFRAIIFQTSLTFNLLIIVNDM